MRHRLRLLFAANVFAITALGAHAQTPTPAQLKTEIGKVIDRMFSTPTVTGGVQAAIDKAAPGDVLNLASTLSDAGPISITKSITLVGVAGPITETMPMPTLRGGVTISGTPTVTIVGVDMRRDNSRSDIVTITGCPTTTFANVRVLGDPVLGQKRGIAANGCGFSITGSIVRYITATDQDTQAIAVWDSPGPIKINDNLRLEASGENVLFGGADPSSPSRVPADISLQRNLITKDLAWKGKIAVKNLVEFKMGSRALVVGNTLQNSWISGQAGWAFVVTPRNQDCRTPYVSITDVTIDNNIIHNIAGLLQMAGTDDTCPSGRLSILKFTNNKIDGLDHVVMDGRNPPDPHDGSDKAIQIGDGPSDVTIDGNTINGANLGSVVYFYRNPGQPLAQRFTLTNNVVPKAFYGLVFGADAAVGDAARFFIDPVGSTIANNTIR